MRDHIRPKISLTFPLTMSTLPEKKTIMDYIFKEVIHLYVEIEGSTYSKLYVGIRGNKRPKVSNKLRVH